MQGILLAILMAMGQAPAPRRTLPVPNRPAEAELRRVFHAMSNLRVPNVSWSRSSRYSTEVMSFDGIGELHLDGKGRIRYGWTDYWGDNVQVRVGPAEVVRVSLDEWGTGEVKDRPATLSAALRDPSEARELCFFDGPAGFDAVVGKDTPIEFEPGKDSVIHFTSAILGKTRLEFERRSKRIRVLEFTDRVRVDREYAANSEWYDGPPKDPLTRIEFSYGVLRRMNSADFKTLPVPSDYADNRKQKPPARLF